jgi:hypothetical protein
MRWLGIFFGASLFGRRNFAVGTIALTAILTIFFVGGFAAFVQWAVEGGHWVIGAVVFLALFLLFRRR